jgi:hypothetical protein
MKITKFILGSVFCLFGVFLFIAIFTGGGFVAFLFSAIFLLLGIGLIRSALHHDIKSAMPKWITIKPRVKKTEEDLFNSASFSEVEEWKKNVKELIIEIEAWKNSAMEYANKYKNQLWLQRISNIGITSAKSEKQNLENQLSTVPIDKESQKAYIEQIKTKIKSLQLDKKEITLDRKKYSRKSSSYQSSMNEQGDIEREILNKQRIIEWAKSLDN